MLVHDTNMEVVEPQRTRLYAKLPACLSESEKCPVDMKRFHRARESLLRVPVGEKTKQWQVLSTIFLVHCKVVYAVANFYPIYQKLVSSL